MTPTFEQRREVYSHAWHDMEIVRLGVMQAAAQKIIAGKAHYDAIERKTSVPWYVVGLLHLRESNCNFKTHLANGDSLQGRTRDVPRGRIPLPAQPPFAFDDAAVDALQLDKLDKGNWSSLERIAYQMELWNGWGYYKHGVPSAYLWAGTNQYKGGKYVADNVFDPHAVDRQLGVMGVLQCIEILVPGTVPEPEHTEEMLISSPKAKDEPISHTEAHTLLQTSSVKYSVMNQLMRILGLGGGTSIGLLKASDVGISDPIGAIGHFSGFVKEYGLSIVGIGMLGVIAVLLFLQHQQRKDLISGNYVPSGERGK